MSSAIRQSTRCTVADYLSWQTDDRHELIDGEAYLMAPAPLVAHQRTSGNIHFHLRLALRERQGGGDDCPCEIFEAPIDVVLGPDTVVQPDLVLVCDPAKLANGKYVDGPPDLAVEVVSASSGRMDRLVKRDLYERCGVAHYWLVDPVSLTLEWYSLATGAYGKPAVYAQGDTLTLPVCGGLPLQLDDVFGARPIDAARAP